MEQEIIEGNKLIAEFMGAELKPFGSKKIWEFKEWQPSLPLYSEHSLSFDCYWDWLMPVVEKIEGIRNSDEYEVDIFGKCCDIGGKIETVGITKIQAVWLAVIEFITWYNRNQ